MREDFLTSRETVCPKVFMARRKKRASTLLVGGDPSLLRVEDDHGVGGPANQWGRNVASVLLVGKCAHSLPLPVSNLKRNAVRPREGGGWTRAGDDHEIKAIPKHRKNHGSEKLEPPGG